MKKSTVGVTIVFILIVVVVVGVYAILTGKARTEAQETVLTPVQEALLRDLERDYPATVKEVIKYYVELEKCFYNEECTDAELEQLGMRARELYDRDLLAINEVGSYLVQLKADVKEFKNAKRRITNIAVASSTNVDYFEQDGFEFARIYCGYAVREADGTSEMAGRVYLLRRDDDRHWKIFGWESADKVNPQ